MNELGNKGFTFIEVMVALALFAIATLLLSQSFINGLICKRALLQENPKALYLDIVRRSLYRMKREQVAASHYFYSPNDQEKMVQWGGKVVTTNFLGLYQIVVKFKGDEETFNFYMRRRDWITGAERLQLKKSFEKGVDETGE